MKIKFNQGLSQAQLPKFFAMLRRAALNLDLHTTEEVEQYRHQVMREEAGVESVKQMNRTSDYDAVMRRFAADAGDYLDAIDFDAQEQKRRAYVIKVLAIQIMQLKGVEPVESRKYLDGILKQAKLASLVSNGDTFYLDVTLENLQKALQILATYRRRLLKELRFSGTAFNDTVCYVNDWPIIIVNHVEKGFYEKLPFSVNVLEG